MKIKQRRLFIATSVILAFSFLILSFYVNMDVFRTVDYDSLVGIQKLFRYSVDSVFSVFTLLGSSEMSLIIISILVLFLWFKKRYMFSSVFLIVLIYLVELVGKILIYHPKPPAIFNRYVLHFKLPSSYIVHTAFSYPSGHMARSAFFGVLLLFLISKLERRKIRKILYIFLTSVYVTGMFVSRIYLGEHWFSDVLGGLILGGGIATLTLAFW